MPVLDPSNVVPKIAVKVSFAQGAASSGSSEYPILLIGNKLASGSAAVNSLNGPSEFSSESDAALLFGAGSELHLMVKTALAHNNRSTLYALPSIESVGVAATSTISFVGAATSNATLTVFVGADSVSVGVVSGDAIATMAAAVAAAINAKTWLPVSASAALGVCTVTAKQKGLRGNDIKIQVKLSNAFGSTVSPLVNTKLAGGTTADDFTSALASVVNQRFYTIIAAVASSDAANLAALRNHVDAQEQPMLGLRSRFFVGCVDTHANAISAAVSLNEERGQMVLQLGSDHQPHELATAVGASIALLEIGDVPRTSFNDFGSKSGEVLQISVPRDGTVVTESQLNTATKSGLTVIQSNRVTKSTKICKVVTTRSLSAGVYDDRIKDFHKVFICDKFADDLMVQISSKYGGRNVANDPAPNKPPVPGAITPRDVKATISSLLDTYEGRGLIEDAEGSKATISAVRPPLSNSIEAVVNIDVINVWDSMGIQLNQKG